jgi:hypothetical protein
LKYIGGKGFISSNTDYRSHVNQKVSYDIEIQKINCCSKNGFHGVFIRERKLNFKFVLALLMTAKTSIQRELDQLFEMASDPSVPLRSVSKSAFTQARAKVNP